MDRVYALQDRRGNYSATAEKLGHSIAIVAIISLHGKNRVNRAKKHLIGGNTRPTSDTYLNT